MEKTLEQAAEEISRNERGAFYELPKTERIEDRRGYDGVREVEEIKFSGGTSIKYWM